MEAVTGKATKRTVSAPWSPRSRSSGRQTGKFRSTVYLGQLTSLYPLVQLTNPNHRIRAPRVPLPPSLVNFQDLNSANFVRLAARRITVLCGNDQHAR